MKKRILHTLISIFILGFLGSCTEPFEIEEVSYEEILVVESTITNELKQQTVKLSRTSIVSDTLPHFERNARVVVVTGTGENFSFSETTEGIYVSDQAFQAMENISYQLVVSTQDGKKYSSTNVQLLGEREAPTVTVEKIAKNGVLGAQVYVATTNATDEDYFRYEYEETYKIMVPLPSLINGEIVNYQLNNDSGIYNTYDIIITPKEVEESICYKTVSSTEILQTTTAGLNDGQIFQYPLRFIAADNTILQVRYSILVKQYLQTREAYNFYEVLNDLGSPESLLSETQPGFIVGNMSVEGNPDEKVIGFFEVSSKSENRIFFDFVDIDLPRPPYFLNCDQCPAQDPIPVDYCGFWVLDYRKKVDAIGTPQNEDERGVIYSLYTNNNYHFIDYSLTEPIYTIAAPACTDCTTFASNVRPDFWID